MKKSFVQLTLRRWEDMFSNPRLYTGFLLMIIAFTVISPLGFDADESLYGRLTLSLTANSICWVVGMMTIPPVRIFFEILGVKRVYAMFMSATICAQLVILILLWVLKSEFAEMPDYGRIFELSIFISLLVFIVCRSLLKSDGKSFATSTEEPALAKVEELALTKETEPEPTITTPECIGVQEKIPTHKRGVIWAIVAQDHYVEVVTDKGSELVLMRLSDAVNMCEAENSMRIHRSAWVSIEGIERITKSGRRLKVKMPNGRELPVARSAEKKLISLAKQIMAEELIPA